MEVSYITQYLSDGNEKSKLVVWFEMIFLETAWFLMLLASQTLSSPAVVLCNGFITSCTNIPLF